MFNKISQKTPRLPFKIVEPPHLVSRSSDVIPEEISHKYSVWVRDLKKLASENIKNEWEYMRISWQARFKVPRYPSFMDYTPEEMILESWEQYYFENPDDLELKGITHCINTSTGYKYYKTGDPLIDKLEESFGRGEIPNLNEAFKNIKEGPNLYRSSVFPDATGNMVPARSGFEGVTKTKKGEKITDTGTKIEGTDFKSDDWLKEALKDDKVLEKMSKQVGINKDANI